MKTYEQELVSKGKYMSYILRHGKEEYDAGLIDDHGWMKIDDLVKLKGYTKELIDDIVKTNNKSRYEYNEDKTKIRARQGHSIPVDVDLKEAVPPKILYHGTVITFKDNIEKEGLIPKTRLYVHLSLDKETAYNVGKRHGVVVIMYRINAEDMYKDGYKFYISNNGVWLTKFVPPKYLDEIIYK